MRYILAIIILALTLAAFVRWPAEAPVMSMPAVTIGKTTFIVEVADSEPARERGLGNRDALAQGAGMLFVFERPGNWGFWMKDTRFALDIVWLQEDGTILSIARGVATSTYPEIFYPAMPDARYVLEVAAGAAADFTEGDKATLPPNLK